MNPHRPYEVVVSDKNPRLFYSEQGTACLHDEVFDWLNERCPDVLDWDWSQPFNDFMQEFESRVVFTFAEPQMALMFKLTWGGA
jgi:hypothetical protein